MTQARATRTWTIGNERVRATLDQDGNLLIQNLERNTARHDKSKFGVVDDIVISAEFVPALRDMFVSMGSEFARSNLQRVLEIARGNIRAAAVALGMSVHTLRHQMKDLGLVEWNRAAHPLSMRQPPRRKP